MYYKVENEPLLLRDITSKAIVSQDVEAYNAFMKKRKQEQEHMQMVEKMSKLENDINDIKNMLSALVGQNK